MSSHEVDEAYFKIEEYGKYLIRKHNEFVQKRGDIVYGTAVMVYLDALEAMVKQGLIRCFNLKTGEILL